MKIFGLLVILLMAAATGTNAAETPHRGGTLVVALPQNPIGFNNAIVSGSSTQMPAVQLFASPLRIGEDWKAYPYLAKSYSLSQDGKTLSFKLRRNAVFHDGTPITSEDVAFSIEMVKKYHPFKTMLAAVSKVDTPDAHTVVVHMSKPDPAILLAMSSPFMPVLPKHIYGKGDIRTNPANTKGVVGSGPFRLTEYKPGQYVVMQRFDKFFLPQRPYLDRIVFKIEPNMQTQMLDLERGSVDMSGFVNTVHDIIRARKNSNLGITDKAYTGIGSLLWLEFNLKRKPFNDVRVRQAINYAIDRDFIVKKLLLGLAKEATGPIHSGTPFYTSNVHHYPLNLKKAERLLDEAGYPRKTNGVRFNVTLDYEPGFPDTHRNTAYYLRSQLKKIGINVTVRSSGDFPTWAKRMGDHDFDMSTDAAYSWGDPMIGVARLFLSTNIRNLVWTNTSSYVNPKVDQLLTHAATESDAEKRKADYIEFQKIVTNDVPMAWIAEDPRYTIYNKRVRNIPKGIWGLVAPFYNVYVAK